MNRLVGISLCLATVLLLASGAAASSYVMVADEDLADGAQLVLIGTVAERGALEFDGRIVTEHRIDVERVLKGAALAELRVRVPGGLLPDGRAQVVFDGPEMRTGERVLLFLRLRDDGTARIEHGALGLFYVAASDTGSIAYRAMRDVPLLLQDPRRHHRRESLLDSHKPRDLEGFAAWIEGRSDGERAPGRYYLAESLTPTRAPAKFSLLGNEEFNVHWHEFTPGAGGSVQLDLYKKGLKGLALRGKGKKATKNVLKAWSKIFNVRLTFAGKGKNKGTSWNGNRDGAHSFMFGDPNDEIDGTYNCAVGGTLASGGGSFSSAVHGAGGSGGARSYIDGIEGDVVYQDGIECLFGANKKANDKLVEEIGAHEVGHLLGIGHSEISAALMAPFAKLDGRGAFIHDDDKNAARALDYDTTARESR